MPIYFNINDEKFYNSYFSGSITGNNFVEFESDSQYLNILAANKNVGYDVSNNNFYVFENIKSKTREEKATRFRISIQNLSKKVINYAGYRGMEELNSLYTEGLTTQQNLEIKDLLDWKTAIEQKSFELSNNYKNNIINNLPTLSSFLYDNDLYLSNYTNTFTRDSVIFLPFTPEQEFPKGLSGCTASSGLSGFGFITNKNNIAPEISINQNTITEVINYPEEEIPDGYEAGASIYGNYVLSVLEKKRPDINPLFSTKYARFNSFMDPISNEDSQGFIFSPSIDIYPSSELLPNSSGRLTPLQRENWKNGDQKVIYATEEPLFTPTGTTVVIITPPNQSRGISGHLDKSSTPTEIENSLSFDCLLDYMNGISGDANSVESLKNLFEGLYSDSGCVTGDSRSICKLIGGCYDYPEGTTGEDIYFPGLTTSDNFLGKTGSAALDRCECVLCEFAEWFRPKRSPFDFLPYEGSSIESWEDIIPGITNAKDYSDHIAKTFNCCPDRNNHDDITDDAGISNTDLWYPNERCGVWKYLACCNSNVFTTVETSLKGRIPLPGIGWVCDEFTWDVDVFDHLGEKWKDIFNTTKGPTSWCEEVYLPGGATSMDPSPCSDDDDCIKHPYTHIRRGYDSPETPDEIKEIVEYVSTFKIKLKLRLIREIIDSFYECFDSTGIDLIDDIINDDSDDDCNLKLIRSVLDDDLVFGDNIYLELILKVSRSGECNFKGTTFYTGLCGCEPYCPCDHPSCTSATGPDGGSCVDSKIPTYLPPPSITSQPLEKEDRDQLQ